MNTLSEFFEKNQYRLMVVVAIIVAGISHVHACELRTDMASGAQTLFGADCVQAVPPGTIGRPVLGYNNGVQAVPVAPAANSGGASFANVSKTEMIGTAIGAGLGLTANSNQGMHAVAGAGLGFLAALAVESLTASNSKPQQVAQATPQPVAQASQATCDGNKTVAILKWSGHPMDGKEVCMEKDDPHR